jgi:hypothetical protein
METKDIIIVTLMIAAFTIIIVFTIRIIYGAITYKDGMNSSRFVDYKSYV